MKLELKENHEKFDKFSSEIKECTHELKSELNKCIEIISSHSKSEIRDLSTGITSICTQLKKLENSRNSLSCEISDMQSDIRDNVTNISNIRDVDAQRKNSRKLEIAHMKETLSDHQTDMSNKLEQRIKE